MVNGYILKDGRRQVVVYDNLVQGLVSDISVLVNSEFKKYRSNTALFKSGGEPIEGPEARNAIKQYDGMVKAIKSGIEVLLNKNLS